MTECDLNVFHINDNDFWSDYSPTALTGPWTGTATAMVIDMGGGLQWSRALHTRASHGYDGDISSTKRPHGTCAIFGSIPSNNMIRFYLAGLLFY